MTRVSEVKDGCASELDQYEGRWQVVADRMNGLDIHIQAKDDRRQEQYLVAHLRLKRGACLGGRMVWDLYLEEPKSEKYS